MRFSRPILLAIALLLFPLVLHAADSSVAGMRKLSKYGNVPGAMKKTVYLKSLPLTGATEAEKTAILGKFAALEAAFARHPLVNKPMGYNAHVETVAHPPIEKFSIGPDQPAPLSGWTRLTIKQFGDGEGGRMTEAKMGSPIMLFYVNYILPLFDFHRIYRDGPGDDFFYLPKKLGSHQGFTIYNDNDNTYFITTSRNELGIPVTREEWIRTSIARTEAARDKHLQELSEGPVAPKEIVEEGREERRRAFEEAYQLLKKHNPAEAEKAKREFEAGEKQHAEEAAKNPIKDGEQVRAKYRKLYADQLAALNAQLKGLSPAARKEPAVYVGEGPKNAAGLAMTKNAEGRPVVRINYNYFHDGKPRQAVRCLTLRYNIGGVRAPEQADFTHKPGLDNAVIVDLHTSLDWAAITAVLDK